MGNFRPVASCDFPQGCAGLFCSLGDGTPTPVVFGANRTLTSWDSWWIEVKALEVFYENYLGFAHYFSSPRLGSGGR